MEVFLYSENLVLRVMMVIFLDNSIFFFSLIDALQLNWEHKELALN